MYVYAYKVYDYKIYDTMYIYDYYRTKKVG